MKKRVFGLFLAALMAVQILGVSANASGRFSDLAADHWAYTQIIRAADLGLVNGYTDGRFGPSDTFSNAQFAAIVSRALYLQELTAYQNANPGLEWWVGNVEVMAQKGLLAGTELARTKASTGAYTSVANQPISRYDMAQIMSNIAKDGASQTVDAAKLAQAKGMIADWSTIPQRYTEAVSFCYAAGLINGINGAFCGGQNMDRAQGCVVVLRLKDYLDNVASSGSTSTQESSPISRVTNTYTVASGTVSADVFTVDTTDPRVRVQVALANNRLGTTQAFSNIVAASDADLIINANFFNMDTNKFPAGHVMADGVFLNGVSGSTSFGFTEDGGITVGRPAMFFYVESGSTMWACYELNSPAQTAFNSVMYTPAMGECVEFTGSGLATTVSNGTITGIQEVSPGVTVSIPGNGYVMFFGPEYMSTEWYRAPKVGQRVTYTPRLFKETDDFNLSGVTQMVSGGPRLVEDGAICTTLEPGFQEARFTTISTGRTAIGTLRDGRLVVVSTSKATIQQMRELMYQLGCVQAVNLDGGASTALSWQGTIVRTPGRELTTTLHIFAD